ncbi:MAG: cobaltochelatase subunit CobN [Planctomycetota bacterium]
MRASPSILRSGRITSAIAALLLCLLVRPAVSAPWTPSSPEPPRVLVVHSSLLVPAYRARLMRAAEGRVELSFLSAGASVREAARGQDLVVFDVPHESVMDPVFRAEAPAIRDVALAYLLVPGRDDVRAGALPSVAGAAAARGLPEPVAARLRAYYRLGGRENIRAFMDAMEARPWDAKDDAATLASFPEPAVMPIVAFYRPDWPTLASSLEEVEERLGGSDAAGRPRVAISFNPSSLVADDVGWLDALIGALSRRGVAAYGFCGPRADPELFTKGTCVLKDGRSTPTVDVLINAALVFRAQQRRDELDRIGVPVIQSLPSLGMDADQWAASEEGLPAEDISYYFASSELAGMVDALTISARDGDSLALEPLPQQIEALADRALGYSRLRRSTPEERRLAVFVYNYPQGEANFGASHLNVPQSLERLLAELESSGYGATPLTADEITAGVQRSLRALYAPELLAEEVRAGVADLLPLETYRSWFRSLPDVTRERIVGYWGSPESAAVRVPETGEVGFVVPHVRAGNVRILPQPLRFGVTAGVPGDLRRARINHGSEVPLSHAYLATYLLARETWDVHALVHFGTHGTVEWAQGKKRGLSVSDDPYLALGSVPNLYPYIMDNLGEATTAKRRGRAVTLSHLPPLSTPAGFRPGLHAMHDVMHDWELAIEGLVKAEMEEQLIRSFVEHGLDHDLGWTVEEMRADFEEFIEELHPFLDDIAQSAQPQGLAVFGRTPSEEERLGMVMQMLRKELIDALGEDIDEVFLLDAQKVKNSRPGRWLRLALRDAEAASTLDLRRIDALDEEKHTSVPNRAEGKELDPERLLRLARRAQELEAALSENAELDGLLRALDGAHVPAAYGGDPVRNPESLPTGRNLYGFDPTRVPTPQAWEVGRGVIEDWLGGHAEESGGVLPEQVAFTLWAGETMRHQGVMEAQVFALLGVRPVWNRAGRVTGLELIPDADLGRARIDTLLSVTGSYRDQFPHLIRWMDEAVSMVAELRSGEDAPTGTTPRNFVAEHAALLEAELVRAGATIEDAERRARVRVFSNEPGVYGTGLNYAVNASDLWRSQGRSGGDEEMADLFLRRMGHAYGEGIDGEAARDLFEHHLARTDVAFLSRSSHTYGVLTSDDPFAYLGGLALAARAAGGDGPELFVQNLRDESEVIVDSAASSIAKEMQTRYLHPEWIRGQMDEGYSGTLQVLKAVQFMWGWEVMDPSTVRPDQWQSVVDVYVTDSYGLGTRQWLESDNQAAFAQMLERMLDAVRLGYWDADPSTQEQLLEAFRTAAEASQLVQRNPAVTAYVEERRTATRTAQPASPDAVLAAVDASARAETAPSRSSTPPADGDPPVEAVSGLELRAREAGAETAPPAAPAAGEQATLDPVARWAGAAAVLLVLLGAGLQWNRRRGAPVRTNAGAAKDTRP